MRPGRSTATCAACIAALIVLCAAGPAAGQAQTRAVCQDPSRQQSVRDARATLEGNPSELAPRLKLADALVDQGCYQDAVTVLEAGQAMHPHSGQLSGKLRDVRSMVTEQSYIEGLTQAEDSAKLQRNLLRCTKLADVAACDEALKSKPDDPQLQRAKADAAAQSRAAATEPLQARNQAEPASGSAGQSTQSAPTQGTAPTRSAAPTPGVGQAKTRRPASGAGIPVASTGHLGNDASHSAQPIPAAPLLEPAEARKYSNEAPAGQTN